MGQGRSLPNKKLLLYSQQTQLQPVVIQQIYEAFMDRAGSGGKMTLYEFKSAYSQINPNAMANPYTMDADAERVFLQFDLDRNGVLTFDEFLPAFALMQRGLVT